eukprot:CAMPEP_0175033668 /NCGR_PEP_ID=MMETSP0005-20121125/22151_1 /TAXON_ID=420556 /ORGANISM="Ochromonas sp., Strain CCMP1393" /LENGTH=152 /DNA_ID=CAMNT_0016294359 /DNA_START=333 /DNA_END=791 /DNA_ORIENTATION=-
MTDWFVTRQRKNPGALVGFKWKPYYFGEQYLDALKFVAMNQIKLVYSTRNPLDVVISRSKHHDPLVNKAHCKAGEKKCIERFQSVNVTIDTHHIAQMLADEVHKSDLVIGILEKYRINYFNTTYEELNFGTKEARLSSMQRMADFCNSRPYG